MTEFHKKVKDRVSTIYRATSLDTKLLEENIGDIITLLGNYSFIKDKSTAFSTAAL